MPNSFEIIGADNAKMKIFPIDLGICRSEQNDQVSDTKFRVCV